MNKILILSQSQSKDPICASEYTWKWKQKLIKTTEMDIV